MHPDLTLRGAAEQYQSEFRYRGRPVGRRRLIRASTSRVVRSRP